MMKVRDFVAGLARAAFGDKAWKKASIYFIMKKVKIGKITDDLCHQNPKKTKRTVNIVAAVAGCPRFSLRIRKRRECEPATSSLPPSTAAPWQCWTTLG
jgi:hypothetical protein